jgi:hypothetical protein
MQLPWIRGPNFGRGIDMVGVDCRWGSKPLKADRNVAFIWVHAANKFTRTAQITEVEERN